VGWRVPARYSILIITNKIARVSNWSPDRDLPDFLTLFHLHLSVTQGTFAVIWFATYMLYTKIGLCSFSNVIGQQMCM